MTPLIRRGDVWWAEVPGDTVRPAPSRPGPLAGPWLESSTEYRIYLWR